MDGSRNRNRIWQDNIVYIMLIVLTAYYRILRKSYSLKN